MTSALHCSLIVAVLTFVGPLPSHGGAETWTAERSPQNPLITVETPGLPKEHGYSNINGPSVIRVPDWIKQPRGKYYLYFAHHRGATIRVAFSDSVHGPWTVWKSGVLALVDTPALDHIASPDVHVDHDSHQIRMYFHGGDPENESKQVSFVAYSDDGLSFTARPAALGPFYFRVFDYGGWFWSIAKAGDGPGGVLLRSRNPNGPFEFGPSILSGMRHAAVLIEGNVLSVFFSQIGDSPERILYTSFGLDTIWKKPTQSTVRELISPEFPYEGSELSLEESAIGAARTPQNAVRDPCIYKEEGQVYLFYSVAGEQGIGLAELKSSSTAR